MIENESLSSDGFLFLPRNINWAICPEKGNEFCQERNLSFSPPASCIGEIGDLSSFSAGPNIDVHGICLKRSKDDRVLVPKELYPFLPVIQACAENEYGIDFKDAHTRSFYLTITRSDVVPGQAHRNVSGAGKWHIHLPSKRTNRAACIKTSRIYTVADQWGTEFYAGPRINFRSGAEVSSCNIHSLPKGVIGCFSSFTIHRSPAPDRPGRRTVLVFNSRAPGNEEPSYSNPMFNELFRGGDEANLVALAWKTAADSIINCPVTPYKVRPFLHGNTQPASLAR